MTKYLEAGRLGAPRGIRGELRFDCWCDSPEFLENVRILYLDCDGKRPIEVVSYRTSVPSIVFKGYEDRTLASALTNRTLWFDRDDIELPDGVCFNDDLLGLKVVCEENGVTYGVLDTIEENITGFYYIVKGGNTSYRVPDVEKYILRRSVGDAIYVSPLEGLEI